MDISNNSYLLSIISLNIVLIACFPLFCHSQPVSKIKGMFVFGDSIVDNGNNVFLEVTTKPNYFPYGIDSRDGPTGRFTNGKTVIDAIGDHLRLPLIPSFYDPSTKGPKITNGVNFASGGSGLLDDTDSHSGKVAPFKRQMNDFQQIALPQLEAQLGMKREQFLGNYLFIFSVGTNDIAENYFDKPITETIEIFTTKLVQLYSDHLKNLYRLGARKFVLLTVYPLGCMPVRRVSPTQCNEKLNNAANVYNANLRSMVNNLNAQMPGSHLVTLDINNIMNGLLTNPFVHGFKDVLQPCCDVLSFNGMRYSPCIRNGNVCPDRKAFMFFDGAHPSEAAYSIIATKAFNSNLQYEVYPINVAQLSSI